MPRSGTAWQFEAMVGGTPSDVATAIARGAVAMPQTTPRAVSDAGVVLERRFTSRTILATAIALGVLSLPLLLLGVGALLLGVAVMLPFVVHRSELLNVRLSPLPGGVMLTITGVAPTETHQVLRSIVASLPPAIPPRADSHQT